MLMWPREYMTIDWGGATFTTDPWPDGAPHLLITGLSGWTDGWTDTSATQPSPGGRGIVRTDHATGSRVLSLTVHASWEGDPTLAYSEALFALLSKLEGLDGDTLTVMEPGLPVRELTQVRVLKRAVTPTSQFTATAVFTLEADDPLRYSAEEVPVSGTMMLRNVGTHASYPLVTIRGVTSKPSVITLGGSKFTAPKAIISPSSTVVLDVAESMMRVNGDPVFPLIASWPDIPAGGTTSLKVSEGAATVRRVSAWR